MNLGTKRSAGTYCIPGRLQSGWRRFPAWLPRVALKVLGVLIILITLFASAEQAPAAQFVTVLVNGREIATDVAPYVDDNYRTIVPARFVAEALGAQVSWDGAGQQASISLGSRMIKLTVGSRKALLNDASVELDTTVVQVQDRVMVPLRFIAETLGADVSWLPEKRTVSLLWAGAGSESLLQPAVVNGSLVNLRQGPGTGYEVVAQLLKGTAVTVRGEYAGWLEIIMSDGKTGWISAPLLDVGALPGVPSGTGNWLPGSAMVVITVDVANVRSGPAETYPVVGQARRYLQMDILGEENGWYKVQMPSGIQGWVAGWLTVTRLKSLASRSGDTDRPGNDSAGQVPGSKVEVTGLSAGPEGKGLALRVTGSDSMAYAIQVIKDPLRLLLDIQGATLDMAGQNTSISVEHPLALQVRVGQFQPEVVRVVVDLLQPVNYEVQSSAPGEVRLVLKQADFQGRTIVIDPGHSSLQPGGWSDPGAVGASGLMERDVVMGIARHLAGLLSAGGAEVILTRTGDTGLSLAERAAIANRINADVFVSIHANSSHDRNLNGTGTYYYAPTGSQLAWQRGERQRLARNVQEALVSAGGRKDLGIIEQNLAVLRETEVPAILVETAFISNPQEEKLLGDPAFQQKLARGIADGLLNYFHSR